MTRFYVTLTWHDWPEGGSYGTIVEAESYAEAEELCRAEMKATLIEEWGEDDISEDELTDRDMNWHLVDCFDLDAFIEDKRRKPEDPWAAAEDYPVEQWQHEVAEDDTRLGYWDWVQHQKDMAHGA